jgi:hypothetical protein
MGKFNGKVVSKNQERTQFASSFARPRFGEIYVNK